MSLYGCPLWALNSPSLKVIEIALNKLLRKVWNLPYNSHTAIVHSVANCNTISNLILKRFCSLYNRALSSSSYWFTLNLLNSCTHFPVIIISMVTTMSSFLLYIAYFRLGIFTVNFLHLFLVCVSNNNSKCVCTLDAVCMHARKTRHTCACDNRNRTHARNTTDYSVPAPNALCTDPSECSGSCSVLFADMPFNGENENSVVVQDNCAIHHVKEIPGHYYLRVLIFACFAIKKNPQNLKTAKLTLYAQVHSVIFHVQTQSALMRHGTCSACTRKPFTKKNLHKVKGY